MLGEAGVSSGAIRARLSSGAWSEPLPGVIDLGGQPEDWERAVLRLVLAAGDQAWASHHTAGHLLGLLDIDRPSRIDVTVRRGRHTRVGGVAMRVTKTLRDDEVDVVRSIPVTSTGRTIVDLAGELSADRLELVVVDAIRRSRTTIEELTALLARRERPRGAVALRAILASVHPQAAALETPLEVAGIVALGRRGAAPPVLQYEVQDDAGRLVARPDGAWPELRVALELDGVTWHGTPSRRWADQRRTERLEAVGWIVIRVTAADLRADRVDDTAARIRTTLDVRREQLEIT
jgi:hypothetical protein